MEALHIFPKTPNQILPNNQLVQHESLDQAYQRLKSYLMTVTEKRDAVTYEEHESVIAGLTRAIGCEALSISLSHYDEEAAVVSVGDQTYRKHLSSQKVYQSAMGPIQIARHLYINRKNDGDGKSICPLELRAGIIEGYWTPNAAQHSAWALAHLTPQETEDLLLRFGGMMPSRSSLDRLPKSLEKRWQENEDSHYDALLSEESIPDEAVAVATSLDGVMVALKPENNETSSEKKGCEWREASCGTVSFFDKEGERISTVHYGQMPEHKKVTLKRRLRNHIDKIQKQRPDLQLIYLADGAQDNWSFIDEEMPLGIQVTDFYHACQYLKLAFDAAYKKNPDKSTLKYEHYRHVLRHDESGIQKVLRALRHLRDKHKDSEDIRKAVTYFQNNQHRMKYASVKAQNYPIGSGIVEASCKSIVGQRLKRSGMSWCRQGGQAILNLRALAKSHRFDKAWKIMANMYRKKIKVHENVIGFHVQLVS